VLSAVIDTAETILGESHDKDLQGIPFAGGTIRTRISDISEEFYDQLVGQLKTWRFAMQVDDATDVGKDENFITYVPYVMENDIKEEFLFCSGRQF